MGNVTILEAARAARCSDKTLRRAIEEGSLKAQPRERANQPILIAVEDLNEYIRSRHGVQVEEVKQPSPVVQEDQPQFTKDQIKISVLEDKVLECLLAVKHFEERAQKLEASRQDVQVAVTAPTLEARIAELERTVQQMEQDAGLAARVAELEQATQQMQEDYQNDRLLGGGRDYLALGPLDDAHYQNRMDDLERTLAERGALIQGLQDALLREQQETERLRNRVIALETARLTGDNRYLSLLDFEKRIQQVEQDQARDISTLSNQLEKMDARLDDSAQRLIGMRELATRLEQELETSRQNVQTSQREMSDLHQSTQEETAPYEGEWTITDANDAVVFHDADPQRARRRLETLATNSPGKRYHLHRPVFTPSSGLATEVTEGLPDGVHKQLKLSTGEIITFRDDFSTPLLVSYRCEAVYKDVDASLVVGPHRQSEQGTYVIGWTKWGKTNPIGREGPRQTKRAQTLLATLEDRTRRELRRAGWVEVRQTDELTPSTLWRKLPENTRLM